MHRGTLCHSSLLPYNLYFIGMNPFKHLCGKYVLIHIFMMFSSYAQFGVNILSKFNYFDRTAATTGQGLLCSPLFCQRVPFATRIRKFADREVFSGNVLVIPTKARSMFEGINTHPGFGIFMEVVRLIRPPPRVGEFCSCCHPSPRNIGCRFRARRHSHYSQFWLIC